MPRFFTLCLVAVLTVSGAGCEGDSGVAADSTVEAETEIGGDSTVDTTGYDTMDPVDLADSSDVFDSDSEDPADLADSSDVFDSDSEDPADLADSSDEFDSDNEDPADLADTSDTGADLVDTADWRHDPVDDSADTGSDQVEVADWNHDGESDEVNVEPDRFTISFIDVEWGDSVYVTTAQGRKILIDAGRPDMGYRVINFIGQVDLDMLILTHPHGDHYGGFLPLLEANYVVGEFIYTNFPVLMHPEEYQGVLTGLGERNVPMRIVRENDRFTVDNLTFEVMHPPEGFINPDSHDSINDNSMVMIISNNAGVRFFEGGDIEGAALPLFLEQHAGEIDVDLMKINHHGSPSATSSALLDATTPSHAFITRASAAEEPTVVLELLERYGVEVYTTYTHGSITVDVVGSSYTITATN